MSLIMAVTMVQKQDLPWAYASLESISRLNNPDGETAIERLVLFNDERDPEIEARLADAAKSEVIAIGRNLGVAGGRNRLVQEARARGAEFILSIDDDIILPPDFAERLWTDYKKLTVEGCSPGVITPATLDYNTTRDKLFSSAEQAQLNKGEFVETPLTSDLIVKLASSDSLTSEDIYHMGIRDWRGGYLFTDADADTQIQSVYGVKISPYQGRLSNLRAAPEAVDAIISGGDPIEIDTAPGGICFYSIAMFDAINGIDEIFNPFGFEDADFALRAKAKNYRHFCTPRAVAVHDLASRLRTRAMPVIKATQGKMIGVFAQRHVLGKEAAAGFLTFSRRIIHSLSAHKREPSEAAVDFVSLNRAHGLYAFCANALTHILAKGFNDASTADVIHAFAASIYPETDSLTLIRQQNRIKLVQETSNKVFFDAEILETDNAEPLIKLNIVGLSVPRELAPSILRQLSYANVIHASISGEFIIKANNAFSIRNLTLRAPGGFRLSGSAQGALSAPQTNNAPKITFDTINLTLQDEGALPRIFHHLSQIEKKSPSELLRAYSSKYRSPSNDVLFGWLQGDSDTINLVATGTIGGAPETAELKFKFHNTIHTAESPIQKWLLAHDQKPINPLQAAITHATAPSLRERIGRLLSEDPATTPFPDTYNPHKITTSWRKIRYLSASRGAPLTPNEARMLKFKNYGQGRRAFIIGNGPSLNKLDLTLLKNEITFGANAIYLNHDKMGFFPTHYVVEDVFVAEDRANEINALKGPTKWIGNYLRYCMDQQSNTCWTNVACDYSNYDGFPHFSTNAARILWVGGTVSYISMQLAYYMGFSSVYLIGFDHSYSIPGDAKVEGASITSTSEDPNHFHPDYFGKGYRWHDPRVDRMETAYRRARQNYESAGRHIFNATAGGKLEVFDRVEYASLFNDVS